MASLQSIIIRIYRFFLDAQYFNYWSKSQSPLYSGSIKVGFILILDTNDANSESTLRELRTKLDSGTSVSINGTDYLMEADSFNQEELSPMQYVNIRSLKVEQTCGKLRTKV